MGCSAHAPGVGVGVGEAWTIGVGVLFTDAAPAPVVLWQAVRKSSRQIERKGVMLYFLRWYMLLIFPSSSIIQIIPSAW